MTDIEIKSLGGATPVGGAGAGKDQYPTEAVIVFMHDDNRLEPIEQTIYIAEPGAHNQDYPSLLGRDVLTHFPLAYDQKGRTFTLGT